MSASAAQLRALALTSGSSSISKGRAFSTQLVVLIDVDLGEERLIAQAPVGVVAAGVDVRAVAEQVQGVVQVGAGVGAFAVVGVDASVHLVELAEDAVLLPLEDGERDRVGIVGLHESILLVLQPVAVGGELAELVGLSRHELVELVMQHPGQRLAAGGKNLHASIRRIKSVSLPRSGLGW